MCDVNDGDEAAAARKGISQFIDELTVALTSTRVYDKDHPRVKSSIVSLLGCVKDLTGADASEPFVLGTANGLLFFKQKALLRASLSSTRLIEALNACRSGGLAIGGQAGEQDAVALVGLLAGIKNPYASLQDANRDLAQRGSAHIRFLPEYRRGASGFFDRGQLTSTHGSDSDEPRESVPFDVPLQLYQHTVALLQDSAVRACHGEAIDLDDARGTVESILARLAHDAGSMMGLARYERYDAYTFGHSIRVCFLSLNFAAALFDDEQLLLRIGLASLLHDIGKARVPFEVLHSTTRLTPEERVEMNKHTTHGGEILLGLKDFDPLAVSVAFTHHQTPSGSGYPTMSHPVRQSIATQIVKICDVYEALTAVRPYKPRLTPVHAYRVMISMKEHFAPAMLRRFIDINGIYPVGSLVELSTGERTRVVRQTLEPLAPVVRSESESDVALLEAGAGVVQDLSAVDAAKRPAVTKVLDDAA